MIGPAEVNYLRGQLPTVRAGLFLFKGHSRLICPTYHKANILDQYHLVETTVLLAVAAVGYSVGWIWMRFLTLFLVLLIV